MERPTYCHQSKEQYLSICYPCFRIHPYQCPTDALSNRIRKRFWHCKYYIVFYSLSFAQSGYFDFDDSDTYSEESYHSANEDDDIEDCRLVASAATTTTSHQRLANNAVYHPTSTSLSDLYFSDESDK